MKKILFSLVAVVLSIGMMGGAFAYFTDVVNSNNNTMTAGTLSISIADNNEGASNTGVSQSFDLNGMAPGSIYETGAVTMQNTGSINIPLIFGRFGGYSETAAGFGDQLKLAYYATSINGAPWRYQTFVDGFTTFPDGVIVSAPGGSANAASYINFWNSRVSGVIPHSNYITLADLVRARIAGSGDDLTSLVFLDYRDNITGVPIATGSTVAIKFGFQFAYTATNAYQGASCNFSVNFIATQDSTYPSLDLADYIAPATLVP